LSEAVAPRHHGRVCMLLLYYFVMVTRKCGKPVWYNYDVIKNYIKRGEVVWV